MVSSAVPTIGRRRPPAMSDVARSPGVSHQTVRGCSTSTRACAPRRAPASWKRSPSWATAATPRRARWSPGTRGPSAWSRPGCRTSGPTSTLIAVEEAARDAGYFVSIATLAGIDGPSVDKASNTPGAGSRGHHRDCAARRRPGRARPVADEVPLVMIAAEPSPGFSFHTMSVDQELGARLATRHLLDLGHREVVHLAGPQNWIDARRAWSAGAVSSPRRVSWRRSRSGGLERGARVRGGPATGARRGAQRRCSPPTTSSRSAAARLRRGRRGGPARRLGGRVRRRRGSGALQPPLTTVRQDSRRWGPAACSFWSPPWGASSLRPLPSAAARGALEHGGTAF